MIWIILGAMVCTLKDPVLSCGVARLGREHPECQAPDGQGPAQVLPQMASCAFQQNPVWPPRRSTMLSAEFKCVVAEGCMGGDTLKHILL